ncbi:glutamate racemase [Salinicola halophyticus]|uniref:glutamate racemase n=1 Tax=Salinicola halophyticus TaxID=1808881 RepID=UPI001FD9786A|nr:glutamate racemase [Salinicola halophyticus]
MDRSHEMPISPARARVDALIFDSGVGGLSVSAEIRRHLPQLSLGYVCDNAALPYGTREDAWLVARIVSVCERAYEHARPRALVIACNTASTLALDALRQRLSIPVIGTVPAIKPAAAMSEHRIIGLLATSATVHRPYLDRLIEEFAVDCQVVRVAADPLVIEAERLLRGLPIDASALATAIAPLRAAVGLDVVVLGCTHFPLLREPLEALLPRGVRWIDSGQAIARRLSAVLYEPGVAGDRDGPPWPPEVSGLPEASVAEPGAASWATAASAVGLALALARFGYAPPTMLEVDSPPSG